MAGNKNSGRPGGNPDIVNIKKTGPRTLKGKLATVFAQGTLRADSKSKLLNQIYRSCAKCPLGPQIKKTTVGTKIIEEETRVSYCKHYKAKKSCSISKDEMFFKLKIYYENGEKNFLEDMDRQLAAESFENAQISKMAETLKYGMPGTNTAAHMKLSADIVNNMRKFTEGEKKIPKALNIDSA